MIDLKEHIGQILYERDSLIIPELGGFVSAEKPSFIDHVQGQIYPPSKKLNFNKNLVINDGVLIHCLQESMDMSAKEAQRSIKAFVNKTLEMLDNREIIVFPGIGRLYKDYENQVRFLQDSTNFNTAVFGLPVLQFYPILRARKTGSISSDINIQPQTASKKFSYKKVASTVMPFLLIAVITIGTLIYYNRQTNTSIAEVQTLPVSENRINKKPGDQLSIFESLTNQMTKQAPEEFIEPEIEPEEALPAIKHDTESATIAPDAKACVIIIGAFSKKAGVEKRVGEIIDLGYSVYQDKKGKLTRVGIQFAYQNEDEIREKLNAMRDNFDNKAWILNQ